MNPEEPGVFRRNLLLVGALHVLVLGGLWAFSVWKEKADAGENIAWLDGGGLPAGGLETTQAAPVAADTPPDEEMAAATPAPATANENTPASELVVGGKDESTPTPPAKPTATPKPTPTVTPKPTATPKPTPKPTARPSPKATPKPKPKPKASASPHKHASPKPSPHKSPTPDDADNGDDEAAAQAAEAAREAKAAKAEKIAKAKKEAFEKAAGEAAAGSGEKGTADGSGGGHKGGAGHAGGGAAASDYGWYHSMLHDRFYSRWDQPTSIVTSTSSFSAIVKIRIEKDGTISDVSLAQSSGNDVMDQSVMEAARRVTQVDPLPTGLGDGGAYEVKINFELSQQSQ